MLRYRTAAAAVLYPGTLVQAVRSSDYYKYIFKHLFVPCNSHKSILQSWLSLANSITGGGYRLFDQCLSICPVFLLYPVVAGGGKWGLLSQLREVVSSFLRGHKVNVLWAELHHCPAQLHYRSRHCWIGRSWRNGRNRNI